MAAGRENFIFFLCPLDGVRFKLRKRLLFSFAYDQKGATNYDKTERENPRGIDRRD